MSHFMLQAANSSGDPAVWFVCLLGVGVVFIGLVVLIAIVSLTNALLSKFDKKSADNNQKTITPVSMPTESKTNSSSVIENKQEILAAVCAAIAEENGTDISAIRVISFKKL